MQLSITVIHTHVVSPVYVCVSVMHTPTYSETITHECTRRRHRRCLLCVFRINAGSLNRNTNWNLELELE